MNCVNTAFESVLYLVIDYIYDNGAFMIVLYSIFMNTFAHL